MHILLILEDEAFKTHLLTLVRFPIITPQNSVTQYEKAAAVPFCSPLETPTSKKLQSLNVKSMLRTQGVWKRNMERQHCLKNHIWAVKCIWWPNRRVNFYKHISEALDDLFLDAERQDRHTANFKAEKGCCKSGCHFSYLLKRISERII